ncbi:MAG: RAMP superfamily CRISPR-associated protein [Acidobacteriota bacterium]|nr:RAMP superfamily CRISPR-associated protein [Acidobacteriota bacterium]
MFHQLQNSVKIRFRLVPDGPILVRAQEVGIEPTVASIEFHRTYREGEKTVFLAGSGLKGVLRAHVERILRSAGKTACDPTRVKESQSCGHHTRKLSEVPDEEGPHAGQCGACFTFGSLKLAGRFRIPDAYPTEEEFEATNQTEVRAGVGIDRKSQGPASGVLYDTEVVVQGAFDGAIIGENFSLWQLGMVLQALNDLNSGMVQIGGCKSRGMGTVKIKDPELIFSSFLSSGGQLAGARQAGQWHYGLPENDTLPIPAGEGVTEETQGLFHRVRFSGAAVDRLHRSLVEKPLLTYLQQGGG